MEYSQVKYVVSVAETLSFSRSAELLYVTQPTLSQQIGRLERELGVRLFDRTTRAVSLTAAGVAFMREARTLIDAWDRTLDAARRPFGDTVRVTVGLLPILGRTSLVEGIRDFSEKHQGVQFEFVVAYSHELVQMVEEGSVDIAIANTQPADARRHGHCEVTPLEASPVVVILNARHRLSRLEHVSLDDLRDEAIVALPAGASVRSVMDQLFRRSRIEPRIVCECDMDSVGDLVAADVGISFLTARVAEVQRDVVVLPLQPSVTMETSIVVRGDRVLEPSISELRRHMIASFESHARLVDPNG
ncbi:MAG: LysR family transcriptional regulator [Cellulomonas sp.]|nr:LysR family transcriptional regulator [Cellulomonas sp.]